MLYADSVACAPFHLRADLARIQPPALVICGGNDRMTPAKYSEYLVENLANARLVSIPGVGHMVMFEAPEETAAGEERFFAGWGGGR